MSWQTYVDDHLMCEIGRGNRLTAAAIIGQDGSVWAQTDRFPVIKPEELTAILNGFAEPGSLAPTGLYIGGTKYKVIQGEPGAVIRGEKVTDSDKPRSLSPSRLYVGGTEYEVTQGESGPASGGKKGTDAAKPRSLSPSRMYVGGTTYKVIQGESGLASRGKKDKPEKVMDMMNDFGELGSPAVSDAYIGGTKYVVIQGETGAVATGKKGSAGVTIKKTRNALIFGLYDEPVTPGDCNVIVENFGDHLIGCGF